MPEHEIRQSEIERNWIQAQQNFLSDMAATATQNQANSVQRNYNKAQIAYLDSMEKKLSRRGDDVETLYNDLRTANSDLQTLREQQEQFVRILSAMETATGFAIRLVAVAAA